MEVEGLLSLAVFIAAFALASLAAQSWRELGILAVLATPFYWALKWLAAGTSFAADTLTWGGEPYKISFSPGDGFHGRDRARRHRDDPLAALSDRAGRETRRRPLILGVTASV